MVIKSIEVKDAKVLVTDGIKQYPFTFSATATADKKNQVTVKVTEITGLKDKEIRKRLVNDIQHMFNAKHIKS